MSVLSSNLYTLVVTALFTTTSLFCFYAFSKVSSLEPVFEGMHFQAQKTLFLGTENAVFIVIVCMGPRGGQPRRCERCQNTATALSRQHDPWHDMEVTGGGGYCGESAVI